MNDESASRLYELDGCLIVPFGEDINAGNISILRDEALAIMARIGVVYVILDMASVVVINRKTFRKALEMVNMIKMMGGDAVFTGIQPGVASVLVDLGLDTDHLQTVFSINEGIQWFRESSQTIGTEDV